MTIEEFKLRQKRLCEMLEEWADQCEKEHRGVPVVVVRASIFNTYGLMDELKSTAPEGP